MTDPALAFFRDYISREGALHEDDGDAVLLVLTPTLRESLDLPDELVATSDPERAREEGAVLLLPGHPALSAASEAVLRQGDAGHAYLPWPPACPAPERLLDSARERFVVDHGRIDPDGEPRKVYLPLLRLGALVTYSLTLDDRFQEREDLWVDARTGLELHEPPSPARLPAPDASHPTLAPDLPLALGRGHAVLEKRATARRGVLAEESREALVDELRRADAYYEEALASIQRRRENASPERRAVLDAQTEATRAERQRRLGEIEESFRPIHELRPFRLQLVMAPALELPVVVRRGERRFPLALTWLLGAGAFTEAACPRCGNGGRLVASRDDLGCRRCLAPRNGGASVSEPDTQSNGGRPRPEERPAPAPSDRTPSKTPARETKPPRKAAKPAAKRPSHSPVRPRPRVVKEGNKLALRFWESVATLDRWPNKLMVPDSPARALYRLWGSDGPALAVCIPAAALPIRFGATTTDLGPMREAVTFGHVETMNEAYPYTLRWDTGSDRLRLLEVVPVYGAAGAKLPRPDRLPNRLMAGLPPPSVELDPVASALWDVHLPVLGLPLVTRCLAAWWRLECDGRLAHPPEVAAAALVEVIGELAFVKEAKRARRLVGHPQAVDAAGAELRTLLGTTATTRGW